MKVVEVTNLSSDTTKEDIKKGFVCNPYFVKVHLNINKSTGECNGDGQLFFHTDYLEDLSLEDHGIEIKGRKLDLQLSKTVSGKILVSNLPSTFTRRELFIKFIKHGSINDYGLFLDENGIYDRTGFVEFSSEEVATKVLKNVKSKLMLEPFPVKLDKKRTIPHDLPNVNQSPGLDKGETCSIPLYTSFSSPDYHEVDNSKLLHLQPPKMVPKSPRHSSFHQSHKSQDQSSQMSIRPHIRSRAASSTGFTRLNCRLQHFNFNSSFQFATRPVAQSNHRNLAHNSSRYHPPSHSHNHLTRHLTVATLRPHRHPLRNSFPVRTRFPRPPIRFTHGQSSDIVRTANLTHQRFNNYNFGNRCKRINEEASPRNCSGVHFKSKRSCINGN